ncbi:MBL fold metallo-hydrolase [Actinacidiphila glaucinigra]|uniref:hypothetical protein n=1 Tax=Actinacidiphila glaucinigra TaxID=235986 RepID=UPI00324CBC83
MRELATGVRHWQAPHPDRTPDDRWPREVSSYTVDDGTRLLLIDPLSVPPGLLARAADRQPVVVLTAPRHERDTRNPVERLGAPVFTPPPDTADDLVRKFGVTREQAGDGSLDLAWLRTGTGGAGRLYAAGDRLPVGVEAFAGREHNDLVLWDGRVRAVIPGDTLVDFGQGLQINDWLRGGVTRAQVAERLRPLLALPVEIALPAHGAPADRAALERALSL